MVGGFLFLAALLPRLPSASLEVHVDMYASKSTQIALFLNSLSVPPQVQSVTRGKRETYSFGVPYQSITRIRVNLAEEPGVHVLLYSISVSRVGGKTVAYYGPSNLATFARYFLTAPKPDPHALNVVSTQQGANIDAFRSVSVAELPGVLGTIVNDSRSAGTRIELAVWLSAAIGALLFLEKRRRSHRLLAFPLLALVSMLVLEVAAHHPAGLVSPAAAVGGAAFFGFSPLTNTHAIEAMYVASVAAAAALIVYELYEHRRTQRARRSARSKQSVQSTKSARSPQSPRRQEVSPDTSDPLQNAGQRVGWPNWGPVLVGIVCFILIAGALLPSLSSNVAQARTQQFVPEWDTNNLLAWTAFTARGLVPMRNFWYPYGNLIYLQSTLTVGPFCYFLYEAVELAGYAWVFWRLSRRSVVVAIVAEIGLTLAMPSIGEFPRYGFAFMVGLVFCLVRAHRGPSRVWLGRALVTVIVGIAALIEADLLVYAAAGALSGTLIEVLQEAFQEQAIDWRSWLLRLAEDLAGPAIVIVATLLLSEARGQLGNIVQFYGHASVLEAYSSQGAPLITVASSLFSLDGLLVWIAPTVFACTILLAWGARRLPRALVTALGVVSGAAAPLLIKDAIRPLTGDLMLVLTLVILLVGSHVFGAVVQERLVRTTRATALRMASLGVIAGLLGAGAAGTGEGSALVSGLGAAPRRAVHDAQLLISPGRSLARTQAQRYRATHFSLFPDVAALSARIRPLLGHSTHGLYVLGDDPIEYVVLHQQPPWQINMYNLSPMNDQRRVDRWLRQERPRVAVLDLQDSQLFDGMPDDVRDPLVYQHVVANYVPRVTVGLYYVLVRRTPRTPTQASFWLKHLGNTVDLGEIPDAEASIPSRPSAGQATPVLQVQAPASTTSGPQTVSIPLAFGSATVTVVFQALPNRRTFDIPMDRLWPWGISHQVRLSGQPSSGWTATITQGFMPRNRLY